MIQVQVVTQTDYHNSMNIIITWTMRASTFFWNNAGTQEEMDRQNTIVRDFGSNVDGVALAEIM